MTPTGSTLESLRDEIDAMYLTRDSGLKFTRSQQDYYDALLAKEARLLRWRWPR